MKSANFPGRKNDRRIAALLRTKPQPAGLGKKTKPALSRAEIQRNYRVRQKAKRKATIA